MKKETISCTDWELLWFCETLLQVWMIIQRVVRAAWFLSSFRLSCKTLTVLQPTIRCLLQPHAVRRPCLIDKFLIFPYKSLFRGYYCISECLSKIKKLIEYSKTTTKVATINLMCTDVNSIVDIMSVNVKKSAQNLWIVNEGYVVVNIKNSFHAIRIVFFCFYWWHNLRYTVNRHVSRTNNVH